MAVVKQPAPPSWKKLETDVFAGDTKLSRDWMLENQYTHPGFLLDLKQGGFLGPVHRLKWRCCDEDSGDGREDNTRGLYCDLPIAFPSGRPMAYPSNAF